MKNVLQLSQSDQTRDKEMKVFNFEQLPVRTLTVNEEPYFVGADVIKILGYKNGSRDIKRHVDDEDRIIESVPQYQNGTLVSKTTLINESGLYSLIFSSKLRSAKKFKRWVTSEVLPKIRRNGYYMPQATANEIMNNPEILLMIAEQVAQINQNNTDNHIQTNFKLETIDRKIEGEYVTPQDLDAIKFATKVRAEKLISETGVQMTIDTISFGDIYEQARANKLAKEKYKYDVGRLKSKIMVAVKKHLKMKGNAPNNHIKRKDVDTCIEFIKRYRNN
ncbi:BRO family protein [Mammaliicoccus sciuri]|uniref:Bro-N domain-containing protein n=1 Tax=Mammaliicoccus sciuri TaxID=1296 RepID=UPI00379B9654